jgi:NADH-quinone oxidoreductase subunit C
MTHISQITKSFPSVYYFSSRNEWTIKTSIKDHYAFIRFLKYHTLSSFNQLTTITAIDHYDRKLRFEVIYPLLSRIYANRIFVSVSISEEDILDSINELYSSAQPAERETSDRFGIFFRNYKDLRRRLTDYGFKGHPLRKDFPLTGFVEVRYDYFNARMVYDSVSLAQEYRIFFLFR